MQSALNINASEGLWQWLNDQQLSLAFTTYQTNRLFLVGCKPEGRLNVNERLFDKPMGLYAHQNSLYMATRYQLWQLENRLAPGENYQGHDRLYIPSQSHTTGDLNVHDVVVNKHGQLLFINTDFSCLAVLRPGYSFEPLWQPPFISKLAAEDRCHLNGLALCGGEATYVTACSRTNEGAGWRKHRLDGGIVMHIPSNEIIATGLSMPHSPRWYQGKLWLLNAGTGELGYLDGERFVPVTFCPGFVRGLAFVGHYALVGLSKLRSKAFGGLVLEQRLLEQGLTSQCGLQVIDLNTGQVVHSLMMDSVVEELFDVVILPNVVIPTTVGFMEEDIDRLVNFPSSNGLVTTKPTVSRPGAADIQIAGLPRQSQLAETEPRPVNYQRVYHLTPDNLAPYDALTYPSLQKRWQTQAQQGELQAISASVGGQMVGFIVAEQQPDTDSESPAFAVLSLFVLPDYRHQGIATALSRHLHLTLGTM